MPEITASTHPKCLHQAVQHVTCLSTSTDHPGDSVTPQVCPNHEVIIILLSKHQYRMEIKGAWIQLD
ncbi:hypothetical protein CDAR_368281 [Caerostris darwini]|uniref:Uncharacterized protein n=1 Tax=Caerostris darwini TaxID=1538125 RepID=A0AAV4WEP7_9ARAC|nr:hypothetical protein CDAR_368281 [Caerostris darwini]